MKVTVLANGLAYGNDKYVGCQLLRSGAVNAAALAGVQGNTDYNAELVATWNPGVVITQNRYPDDSKTITADPLEKLPQIVYWLMGSLSGSSFEELAKILPFYIVCMVAVFLLRWRTNVLSLGDQEAKSFGLNVRRDRAIVIGTSSMLTALVVSISGIIGWVGIVVPHLARMLVGPDFRKLIPTSVSIGICYLLVVDDLCRTLTASEIPLGVITGIIGVPLFLYFIYKKKVSW